jgi:hypothetical protein
MDFVFKGLWQNVDNMIGAFGIKPEALENALILLAKYEYECYTGDALVIYMQNGKLYEVNGGHCSCYGLEGQWEPEETTWEALAIRPDEDIKALVEALRQ